MSNQSHSFDQDRFDALVRQRHVESLHRLSPQVRAQLVQRRNAAVQGKSVDRGHGVRIGAAAFATLCALAIGLQMQPSSVPGDSASGENMPASVAANGRAISTMLDEDPEFYAWLASSDAQQVAME